MALTDSIAARTAKAQAIADLCDQGSLNPNAQLVILDAQSNELCVLEMSNPAFAPAVDGEITANTITGGSALTTGTAATFVVKNRDGELVYSGSVGLDGTADLTLPSLDVEIGVNVTVSNLTRTES